MKTKVTDIITITVLCLIPVEAAFALQGEMLLMTITMGVIFQLVTINFLLLGLEERDDRLIKKQRSADANK